MAFKTYPAKPNLKSEAEKSVYGRLIDQLPDDAEVFCNIEYFNGQTRREIDFLVSIPEVGLFALEVKGGAIIVDGQEWFQWDIANHEYRLLPLVHQLDEERRMVNDRLRGKITQFPPIAWFVVFPDTEFGENDFTPGFRRSQIISKNERTDIYRLALQELRRVAKPYGYSATSQEIVRREFGNPNLDYSYTVETAQSRAGVVDNLSVSQAFLLDLLQDNSRLLIKGGPGSGKTILAIEHATRLAESRLRVGLVCFNRGLAKLLQKRVEQINERKRPHFVGGILEELPAKWNLDFSTLSSRDLDDLYTNVLPAAILEIASKLQDHQKYDAWVVDEAQDLKPMHWEILRASLRDPENGIIHAFGDNEQNLFKGAEDLPWFYAIGRLGDNLRSSKTIARTLQGISENAGAANGPIVGTPPEVIYVDNRDDAESVADTYAQTLIDEFGWQPGDIAVITTRQRHSKQVAQLNDIETYWDDFFAGEEVMYTNVNSFKGLERPVIIVAVNGIPHGTDGAQRLYVAMSRARDDLIVVGTKEDLASIEEILGSFSEVVK